MAPRHTESNPSILSSGENAPQVLTLGVCGGLLAAAAASIATTVSELVELASLLAGITCRVAVEISRRAINIEDDVDGSWAFSVLGTIVPDLPSILDQFHEAQVRSHNQIYSEYETAITDGGYIVNSDSSTSLCCCECRHVGNGLRATFRPEKASRDIHTTTTKQYHKNGCFWRRTCRASGASRSRRHHWTAR